MLAPPLECRGLAVGKGRVGSVGWYMRRGVGCVAVLEWIAAALSVVVLGAHAGL